MSEFVTISAKMYEDMKAEGNRLATMSGTILVMSDSLERIKDSLVRQFGFPNNDTLQWLLDWTEIDRIVCRLRELTAADQAARDAITADHS